MLTLTAYFDASGTHQGSSNVTLAGWISTEVGWTMLDTEWRKALADYGLPMFHMRKFAHGIDEFEHWSEPQRRIRFGRLAKIIADCTLASIAVCVPIKEFEEEFTPEARAHVGGPYGMAAALLMLNAAHYVEESLKPERTPFQIAYVLESGDVGAGQVLKFYQANMMSGEQVAKLHLLSLRFEDKRKFVALQAADILAYELWQQFPRQMGLDPREPRRYNLRQLAANKAWDWRYMSRERMREDWARVLDIAARVAVTEGWPRRMLPDDWTWDKAKPVNARNLAIRPNSRSRRRSKRDG